MIIKGIDSVDLSNIYPGDTVKLKICKKSIVSSLINLSERMGCKLIFLNYGEFYFQEFISIRRDSIIDNILSD
tara:strand:+ start:12616 stop:12834 length:219 start_codon:yes stop_codon:yes gene_type:complete